MRVFIINNYFLAALPDDAIEIKAEPPVSDSVARWNGDSWAASQQVYIRESDGVFVGTVDRSANPMGELALPKEYDGCIPIEADIPSKIMRRDLVNNLWVDDVVQP